MWEGACTMPGNIDPENLLQKKYCILTFLFLSHTILFLICILLKILCSDCNANLFFALTHSAMHR